MTGEELAAEFDSFWTSAPELGGTPQQAGVVVDAYRDLVRHHFMRTGDAGLAKAAALKDVKRTYAVSEITGNKRLMRYRPEDHYPKVASTEAAAISRGESHDYIREELVRVVNDWARGSGATIDSGGAPSHTRPPAIPIEDIFIEAIPQTNADIAAGRYPGYAVWWRETRDGIPVLNTAPGMVFRADVAAAQAKQSAWRKERSRLIRGEEIYKQSRLRGMGVGGELPRSEGFDITPPPVSEAELVRIGLRGIRQEERDRRPDVGTMEGFLPETTQHVTPKRRGGVRLILPGQRN